VQNSDQIDEDSLRFNVPLLVSDLLPVTKISVVQIMVYSQCVGHHQTRTTDSPSARRKSSGEDPLTALQLALTCECQPLKRQIEYINHRSGIGV